MVMRKMFAVLIFTAIFIVGCDYGYGSGGDLPEGHHDQAGQYAWHVIYDDGVVLHEYYLDTQPLFNTALSSLELMNAREGRGPQLMNTFYDELSFPVDEFSILKVIKQPMRNDNEDLDNFEWRVVFTDASGNNTEFYLHHQPEELWGGQTQAKVIKMVRGYTRTGKNASGWSFSEYYLAGSANFFLIEERPQDGWN